MHGTLGVCPRCINFVERRLADRTAAGIKSQPTLLRNGVPVFSRESIREYWLKVNEQIQVMGAVLRLSQITAGNIKPIPKPKYSLEEMKEIADTFIQAAWKVYGDELSIKLAVQFGELPDCFDYNK